jgi:tubulin-specific chaperone E
VRVMLGSRKLIGSVPGAGSFIRPNKPADEHTSFLQALHRKYYSSASHQYKDVFLESSGKQIEMIGFDKIEKQQSSVPPPPSPPTFPCNPVSER